MFLSWFWAGAVLCAAFFAFLTDTGTQTTSALLSGAADAVEVCIAMAGPLCLWAGLGKLMDRSGLTAALAKLLSPVLGRLFPSSREDGELAKHLSANVTANLLGLGNAATPAGIRAATLLEKQGEAGARALAMLLVLNNSGLQLMPTTVITLRSAAGAAQPADIWLPTLAASAAATLCGGVLMWLLNRGGVRRG